VSSINLHSATNADESVLFDLEDHFLRVRVCRMRIPMKVFRVPG
jgi:hypothetical protein